MSDWPALSPAAEHADRGNGISGHAHGRKQRKLSALLHEEAALLFQKEPELKHTIQTFIEHNSNMSLTSKKLHLHRNSLQYRIDKFAERSGIDIKTYQGALLAYFICLQYEKSH